LWLCITPFERPVVRALQLGERERRDGERARLGIAAHQHVLERQPSARLGHARQQRLVHHQQLRAAVLETLAQPLALVVGVGRHPDRAQLVEAERGPDVVGAALHHDRDRVAARDSERCEAARHGVGELVHAAVREVRIARHEEVAVGDRLGLAAQAAAEQPVAPVVESELVHAASGSGIAPW
jgi:hypothetical protein